MKHTRERVREIDKFLREFYPDCGVKSCAESLGESETYIRNRAHNINLSLSLTTRKKPGAVRRNEEEKIINFESKIRKLKRRNEKLEELNSSLRKNLIKLVSENKALRDEFDI